jgi:DNA repair exonuclease SbcCD ATPase subunit
MSTKKPLHIIRLSLTNCGIIEAAAICPDTGKPTVLCGDNGQGKSTVLNAIESVLFGRKLAEPITHGQDKAEIKLDLAEAGETKPLYRIEQVVKKTPTGPVYGLKVYDADKKQVPSPRDFINSLIASGAALDPTEIMQARPGERPETFAKRQAETLMERLGLSAQAATLDAQIADKAETRKIAKNAAEALQSRLEALEVPTGTPDDPVDVAELGSKIATYKQLEAERGKLEEKVKNAVSSVEHTRAQLEAAQKAWDAARDLEANSTSMLEHFNEMNPKEGLASAIQDAQERLSTANATNAAVTKKRDRKALSVQLAEAEGKTSRLTTELDKLREQRLDIVRNAKIPVEGLELTESALLYNGAPLAQESTANRIRVCCLLAMSEAPECRVLFLREGALMNSANKAQVYAMAAERSWQIWTEEFSETPKDDALWISAGTVSETPAKKQKEGTLL